jgi:hypothetical protein
MSLIKVRKPSPALVVAILALIVAMAGGAYAVTLPKKSVGPKQLKAGAVKTGKIRDGAVITSKLGDAAVTAPKLGDAAVTAPKLGTAAVIAAKLGPAVIHRGEITVGDGVGAALTVSCGSTERLLSGGARLANNVNEDLQLTTSRPVLGDADPAEGESPNGWRAAGFNPAGGVGPRQLRVFVLCLQ